VKKEQDRAQIGPGRLNELRSFWADSRTLGGRTEMDSRLFSGRPSTLAGSQPLRRIRGSMRKRVKEC